MYMCMYLLNEFGLDVHCVAGQEGTEGGEGGGDEKTRDHLALEQRHRAHRHTHPRLQRVNVEIQDSGITCMYIILYQS